jgi:hypothetical protein
MLQYIQESIEGLESLKGRSTDVRQMDGALEVGVPAQDVDPGGWLIMVKHGRSSKPGMGGPVPILLIGHEDMDPRDFRELLHDLCATQEKQITPPAGAKRYKRKRYVDARELLFYGKLHMPFKGRYPVSAEALKGIVARLDDLVSHPLASQFINKVKDAGPLSLRELQPYLDRLSLELVQPPSRPRTRGDLVAYGDYRFHNSYFRT